MKKSAAFCLILALLLCIVSGYAEGGIRHEVTGDLSEFEVSEEQSEGVENEEGNGATLGTDVYLFVDPDTASYITFIVVDEDGNPIKGAAIYLTYRGHTQFYGMTDSNGEFSTYLFRNATYEFTVKKEGYRTETGTFVATEETKIIRVVLRKYRDVDFIVLEDGLPKSGVEIIINGKSVMTDENGHAQFWLLDGEYDAEIVLPDGTKKTVKIIIDGDKIYIIEIGTDSWPEGLPKDLLANSGLNDTFIVFDKYYDPEDYDLTAHVYTDEEILAQLDIENMTDEEVADIVEAYHLENEDHLHIVAEPDKIQYENAPDEIVVDEENVPVYSQRSLILSGWQMLNIENAGVESLLFENENMGLWFDIADLHSENMARLFWLLQEVKTNKDPEKYSWYREDTFEVGQVNFSGLKNVWRWMDPEEEYTEESPVFLKETFGNSRLEVRITPILEEEIERAVIAEEKNIKLNSTEEIVLISEELQTKWLGEYLADGHLSDTEYAEIEALCVHGKAYRVQIFMLIEGRNINVTELIDSLEIRFDVNEDAVREAEQYVIDQQLIDPELDADVLREEYWNMKYSGKHTVYGVRNEGVQLGSWNPRYEDGDAVFEDEAVLDDEVTENEMFKKALESRLVDVYDVDVRYKAYEYNNDEGKCFYAVVDCFENVAIPVERDWHVCLKSDISGLYLIREHGCTCVEDMIQALNAEEE